MSRVDTECQQCGEKLDIQRSCRPARYCSGRCRTAAYRARKVRVPKELRTQKRWVRWTRGKRPIQPDGSPASTGVPGTWTSYARVREHTQIGYVLGDGVGCIDLDHCLTSDGKLTAAAERFLEQMPSTWIEVSPSGDGLHIWGRLPESVGRRIVQDDGLHVETYSRGRYITVTGKRFRNAPCRLAALPVP
ncbi:hypothetical protein NONO_c60680 [Nocardia nova SH22a]|uniref:DNA primase/polymerase bifunctional N-terminal domain-containing protein n=1 Tax=Nocardia nova SH22a TaxID=1415166 RepID=W5TNV8_9NOCA|nr:bifunctional DNA primase/polymerase [Nocardia nova]AHH20844.1 hypothetical protein NONO_c60680 [Nocardia nova SH22a]